MITSTSVWKLQSVSLSLSLSTVNFWLFFSLGQTWKHQPSWFSQQASHHTTLSSYIAWLLAGVLGKVDFPHCIAMHALLVKVRIEINSFLFHVKSKHTLYCVFMLCASIISGPLRLILRHFFTCKLTCIAYLNNISLKQGHPTSSFGKYLFGRRFEI